MRSHKIPGFFPLIMGSALLMGCVDSGELSAREWMAGQRRDPAPADVAPVPTFVDTPPATYQSKIADPFLSSRITMQPASANKSQRLDVLFPDAPISALSVAGYLSGENRVPVAMVRHGTQYRGVRVGDRLGEQAALVKQIDAQGVLIAVDGAPEQRLPINKP